MTAGSKIDDFTSAVSLETLLKESDYLSVHLPLNDETKYFFNKDSFSLMKKDSILINTSRGALINESDLYNALLNKDIRGAALDVMENEPPLEDNPILKLENILITDHRAYYSEKSLEQLKERCAANVVSVLKTGCADYEI